MYTGMWIFGIFSRHIVFIFITFRGWWFIGGLKPVRMWYRSYWKRKWVLKAALGFVSQESMMGLSWIGSSNGKSHGLWKWEIESHPVLVQVRYLRRMPTLDSCRRFLKWGYPRIQFIFGISMINHPVMGVPPTMETGHPQSQLADWPGLCWPCCHELQAPRDLQEGSHVGFK